jgi:hypothetical protein
MDRYATLPINHDLREGSAKNPADQITESIAKASPPKDLEQKLPRQCVESLRYINLHKHRSLFLPVPPLAYLQGPIRNKRTKRSCGSPPSCPVVTVAHVPLPGGYRSTTLSSQNKRRIGAARHLEPVYNCRAGSGHTHIRVRVTLSYDESL